MKSSQLRNLSVILLGTFILAACHKDKDEVTPGTIVGFWKGKYGSGLDAATSGYAFLFNSDGTVSVFDGDDTLTAARAHGAYVVRGHVLTTTYYYNTSGFQTSSTVNDAITHSEGTWGSSPSSTDGGIFYLDKQ